MDTHTSTRADSCRSLAASPDQALSLSLPEPEAPSPSPWTEQTEALAPPALQPRARAGEPWRPPHPCPVPPLGEPRFGRYRDLDLVAEGGMGRIYKAWDPVLRRPVALKRPRPAWASPCGSTALIDEGRIQVRLRHPHVCRVYGFGEIDEEPFLCLEWVPGKVLRLAHRRMRLGERVSVVARIAEAVEKVHGTGFVHCDVNPRNILVVRLDGDRWHPCLIDFGIARRPGLAWTGSSTSKPVPSKIFGTPAYMAPEQVSVEAGEIGARTDVYGLGATLYELLSHHRPFPGGDRTATLYRLLHEDPRPVRKLEDTVPRRLEEIVMCCLAKAPAARFQSAGAVARELDGWSAEAA